MFRVLKVAVIWSVAGISIKTQSKCTASHSMNGVKRLSWLNPGMRFVEGSRVRGLETKCNRRI